MVTQEEYDQLKVKFDERELRMAQLQLEYDGRVLREQGTEWREGYFDGCRSMLMTVEMLDDEILQLKGAIRKLLSRHEMLMSGGEENNYRDNIDELENLLEK